MKILVAHFGISKRGTLLLNWIVERHRDLDEVSTKPIESVEHHGFYGWLIRSMVPGFSTKAKPINLEDYDLIYLIAPKWAYSCPVINGFLNAEAIRGKTFAIIVTYSKGNPAKYVNRLSERIRRRGGIVAGRIAIGRSEIEGGAFPRLLENLIKQIKIELPHPPEEKDRSTIHPHEHVPVFIGMINVNRDGYLQGVVDVYRCTLCRRLSCDDRRYGERLKESIGFEWIPHEEQWGILTCTNIKSVHMMSLGVKPGKKIMHECRDGRTYEFTVKDDWTIESDSTGAIHRLILAKDHLNENVEAGYYKLRLLGEGYPTKSPDPTPMIEHAPKGKHKPDFSERPLLVFWETTRACLLSCIHCRASAITNPLPGELTKEDGYRIIDQVVSFGEPYPTIIFTGGDPMKRVDLPDLLRYSSGAGVPFAVSPAVSELLTDEALRRMKDAGASSISVSLDGANPGTHDTIRGRRGTYDRTIEAIQQAISVGLTVQVNTAIMKRNIEELPSIFHSIRELGVRTWELFFLIRTGRGSEVEDLSPEEYESVCDFLFDASHYGMTIRTVEAPFIRRVAIQRTKEGDYWKDEAYLKFRSKLLELEGEPVSNSTLRPRGTLDGDGIIFVSYDGTVYPGGLLPVAIGNVRNNSLTDVYRESELLRKIRERKLNGYCGMCEFRDVCGGSRARAYSYSGDPLASDPACTYVSTHPS